MIQINKNELILLKQSEIEIYKYYKEYISFMGINFEMPSFKVKFKKATKEVFANVNYSNNKFILTVDPLLCITRFKKPILYHEFTHIYDGVIMDLLELDKPYLYHIYTEYHASQIEMMVNLNLKEKYGIIINNLDHNNLYNKLLDEKSDFTKIVNSLNFSSIFDLNRALNLFCYYIGKTNTFIYYFDKYKDILLDLSEFYDVFGDDIIHLQNSLFKCDTNNITVNNIFNTTEIYFNIIKKFNSQ